MRHTGGTRDNLFQRYGLLCIARSQSRVPAWLAPSSQVLASTNIPVEDGPPVSPLVFFSSLELVWECHGQIFLKNLRKVRGQRSRQRRMKTLRLRPRPVDRTLRRKANRASLVEETIVWYERKGMALDVRLRR
jgi:hypothetical protein